MVDRLTAALIAIQQTICGAHGPVVAAGAEQGITGPVLGNLLVIAVVGTAALACIVLALRMVFRPGETESGHPKYGILSADR